MAKCLKIVLLAVLLTVVVSAAEAGTNKSDVQAESAEEMRREGEGSESWTTWAMGRFSKGLGIKDKLYEEKLASVVATGDATKRSKDKTAGVASDTGSYVSERADQQAKESGGDASKRGKDKAEDGGSDFGERASKAKDATMEKGTQAKETLSRATEEASMGTEDAKERAKGKAKDGYGAAKAKAGETVDWAKEKIASSYEAVKEKVVGRSHRRREEEL